MFDVFGLLQAGVSLQGTQIRVSFPLGGTDGLVVLFFARVRTRTHPQAILICTLAEVGTCEIPAEVRRTTSFALHQNFYLNTQQQRSLVKIGET